MRNNTPAQLRARADRRAKTLERYRKLQASAQFMLRRGYEKKITARYLGIRVDTMNKILKMKL